MCDTCGCNITPGNEHLVRADGKHARTEDGRAAVTVLKNLLSVGAGYGAVVAVFQYGWGAGIFGLDGPSGAIPLSIPLMLFCIIFGLSMDYEVFLLHRIKEVYEETGDNTHATVEGVASTAGIITSAALIMVVVFGAFAWAEMVIVQMLGLGLAVAVLVDATIIRALLVPAAMKLMGDWNWWAPAPLKRLWEKAGLGDLSQH